MVEYITDSQKIEDQLKQANGILNSIFEGPENIIAFSLDSQYKYIFYNQAHSKTMKNIWGADIEIGMDMLEYISYPEDRKKAKTNFDRVLSGKNFVELEEYGEETLSRRYWENIYSPIQSDDKIIGVTVFSVDITERHKAENLLKESEEKFRAVSESAVDAIVTTDSMGKILFFNHSFLELFGYSASELSGKPVSILIPEEHKKSHEKGIELSGMNEKGRKGKTTMVIGLKKDGKEFPCEMSLSAWKSGKNTYYTSIIRDLTKQKKAENEIILAKEEWENTFDAVPDLISILDADYHIVRSNKAMNDRLGVDTKEAIGLTCYSAVHGLNEPPAFCPNLKLLEDGREHSMEIHEDLLDGDFLVTVAPLRDSNGKLMGSVHVARDITERKRAEESIKESEAEFRALFENANDMITLNEMKEDGMPGNFIEVNKAGIMRMGYSREEFLNMSPIDIVAPNKQAEIPENAAEIQRKGYAQYEMLHLTKDGKRIPVEINNHLFELNGRTVSLAISRDITERKKAEDALKSSQNRLNNAMDMAHLANWELDLSTNMFLFNNRIYSMFGTTMEREGGYLMSVEDYARKFVHPDDAQFIGQGIKGAIDEGGYGALGTRVEHRIITPDGITRNLAIIIKIIPRTESRKGSVYGTVQDITEQKKVEIVLKQSVKEKETLLKEIHHRVKNNLMIISSLLNLQSGYIKDKESIDIFKESQNRARSMALIHERLYQSTDLKNIDFGDYIRTLSNELFKTYVADQSLIELEIDVEDIFLDINTAIPLGLIVNELITNSLKHAFPDSKSGVVNVDFHPIHDQYEFRVKDNGIGFPEDIDFRNTDSLGLQMVNNLTEQIDGKIKLKNENGTEFRITFKETEIS